MEKEQPDSMATVAIKPDYPPSEYSASEPPPAYRRPMSSAVQIARIAAFTIVASSCILGAFILASSWVSERAGCRQLEQLDAMLDKELALEGRSYGNDALVADEPLPLSSAHALHGAPPPPPSLQPPAPAAVAPEQKKPVSASHTQDALNKAESKVYEDNLQKLDGDKDDSPNDSSDESESSDSNEDEEDLDPIRGTPIRLPIQFDLDDLAGAFLANNNQKGRMNCVVERRREEVLEKRFPFNILGAFGAKPEPAERIAIICHGDDKPVFPEPAAQVFAFPLSGPSRLPLRPMPPAALQPPAPMQPSHRAAPFPMPMSWDSYEDQNTVPREMRIHVQRIIAIPASNNMQPPPEPNMIPFPRLPLEGPFSRDMRPQDMPFPRDMRPQDMPFSRDMRPQDMPFPRDMRPQDMPTHRNQEMPFPRPQDMPFPRPHDMPFPRPQEMPFPRPQEIPFNRPQENVQFLRPQETVIAFPRQQTQENMTPFHQPQQQQQPQQGEQNEQSTVMHQFVPQPPQSQEIEQPEKIQMESMGIPMSLPWGLTPETLRAIHRHAVEADQQQDDSDADQQQIDNDMQEVKTIVNTLAAAAAAEAEGENDGNLQSQERVAQNQDAPAQDAPIHIDAPVLIEHETPPEERPHYVQPRSVRSVDALHREKRVKRCSCDCA